MTKPSDPTFTLTRRGAIAAFALAPAAAQANGPTSAKITPSPEPGVCTLAPEAEEGPFYFDPALERVDITEGLPGVPLEIRLALQDAATCAPLKGVRVDVWHANAAGAYSGFGERGMAEPGKAPKPKSGKRDAFLRGTQFSDANGALGFGTIYPGWYPGRTPHVHLKAFLDGKSVLTTQLYFPDALSEYLYEHVTAYSGRSGKRDTTNTNDGVLADTENPRATFANLREEADRYVATLTIAVDRNARPAAERRGPPPPPPGDGPRGERRGPPPGDAEGMPGRGRPRGPLVPGVKA